MCTPYVPPSLSTKKLRVCDQFSLMFMQEFSRAIIDSGRSPYSPHLFEAKSGTNSTAVHTVFYFDIIFVNDQLGVNTVNTFILFILSL